MKKLLLLIVLLNVALCHAQNYNCLQGNTRHFFTNSKGYLRCIYIDSVRVAGTDTVYYPFKTPRLTWMLLDTSRGSWVGSRVIKKSDGTFLFNSAWNDTVVIKTQAAPGDSWVFYNDTSARWYRASIVSADTMTFLGITDSVKRIKITCYVGSTINAADSINNFEIVLSKNNGFVKTFDFYLFPYHEPTTATFNIGLDPCLFELAGSYSGHITAAGFMFSMIDYHAPTELEIFDFNVGDVFITGSYETRNCGPANYARSSFDSIIGKTVVSPYQTHYTIYRWRGTTTILTIAPGTISHDYYTSTGSLNVDTSVITEFVNMPECANCNHEAWYYLPNDTSHCITSPVFKHKNIITFEGCDYLVSLKRGFEQIKGATSGSDWGCPIWGGPICEYTTTSNMTYSMKNGIPCGNRGLASVKTVSINDRYSIFPNPANGTLNITSPEKISSVAIHNLTGQIVHHAAYNAGSVAIDISFLPPGMYFAKINNSTMMKFVKQ